MSAVAALAEAVARNADRPYLIEGGSGRTVTHGEAAERALAVAALLREAGVRRGDRVAVAMPNGVELPVVYLAALMSGVVVVPIGSGFGRRELRTVLDRARPAVAVGPAGAPLATLAAELEVPVLSDLDVWGAPISTGSEPFDNVGDDDLVSVHFTSGSTGLPRGVGHRLGDFVRNAERYAEAAGLDAEHRFHHTLPMTYMAGYYNLLLLPLRLGASVVVDRAFDARSVLRFWDVPRQHGADVLWLVPTIMAMLLKVDRSGEGREYCRERVRHVACGTAPLDPDLRERFESEYGVAVHDSYGLSETLLAAVSSPQHPASRGAVGTVLPGVEVRTQGSPGPVLIRSPDTMVGYLEGCGPDGAPRFSLPVDADGWMDTGDIGVLDGGGELRITGREKDIVIRGGVNVSAVEVERELEDEEGVERLAVVGVPHEILGEQLVAVVATDGSSPFEVVESTLKARAKRLDGIPRPDVYVHIDAMPTTPTGKVRKGALRDMVIDRLGLPSHGKGFAVDAPDAPAPWGDRRGPIDLTHPVFEGMVSFPSPNHPAPQVTVLARHEEQGRMTRRLVLGSHTGTHADAPLHFVPGGTPMDELEIGRFVGPAQLVDLTAVGPGEEVTREHLEEAMDGPPRHPRVVLRFGWDARFVDQSFYHDSPWLALDACRWLLDHGLDLLGMDTPSPDDPRRGQGSGDDSPNHHLLLGAGVIMLEYLANLGELPAGDIWLVALPLKVRGADGAPVRVVAFA